MKWQPVIGLEVHVQLATHSKIFSGAPTDFGARPNSQIDYVDLGLPGALPVPNKASVEMAVKFGLAVDAEINQQSVFARKNYFYPDLPKGYQISQYEEPIVKNGKLILAPQDFEETNQLEIDATLSEKIQKIISITRAHLEEDAGKLLHDKIPGQSGIDFNRAGMPLLEIVSAPELYSAKEAIAYLRGLYRLVTYLGICTGNLEEGQFRCDANVSVRKAESEILGTRVEIKNLNSFRFIEKAIEYEIERQIICLENHQPLVQETRLFDSKLQKTRSMRQKEEAHDYRYFPDPDLLPLYLDDTFIQNIKTQLPELPQKKYQRFLNEFGLSKEEAAQLIDFPALALFFEETLKHASLLPSKLCANWLTGEMLHYLNTEQLPLAQCPITPKLFGVLLTRIADGTISAKIAKKIFSFLCQGETDVDALIAREGLQQISDDSSIQTTVNAILLEFTEQVAQYLSGKEKVFGFLLGQAMKKMQGKANPNTLNRLLLAALAKKSGN